MSSCVYIYVCVCVCVCAVFCVCVYLCPWLHARGWVDGLHARVGVRVCVYAMCAVCVRVCAWLHVGTSVRLHVRVGCVWVGVVCCRCVCALNVCACVVERAWAVLSLLPFATAPTQCLYIQ